MPASARLNFYENIKTRSNRDDTGRDLAHKSLEKEIKPEKIKNFAQQCTQNCTAKITEKQEILVAIYEFLDAHGIEPETIETKLRESRNARKKERENTLFGFCYDSALKNAKIIDTTLKKIINQNFPNQKFDSQSPARKTLTAKIEEIRQNDEPEQEPQNPALNLTLHPRTIQAPIKIPETISLNELENFCDEQNVQFKHKTKFWKDAANIISDSVPNHQQFRKKIRENILQLNRTPKNN